MRRKGEVRVRGEEKGVKGAREKGSNAKREVRRREVRGAREKGRE